MTARLATLDDAHKITEAVALIDDDQSLNYRWPYRVEYPEDYNRCNLNLFKLFLDPAYEDYAVVVVDAPNAAGGNKQIAAFSVWDLTYLNKRKHGPTYVTTTPFKDLDETGRRDANLMHLEAYGRNAVYANEKYLSAFGERMHLAILGTVPQFRRRGYASALVRWGMDKARVDQVPVTVGGTPLGVATYRSLGFRELGKTKTQVEGEEEFIIGTSLVWEPCKET